MDSLWSMLKRWFGVAPGLPAAAVTDAEWDVVLEMAREAGGAWAAAER